MGWRDNAACRGMDTNLFHPAHDEGRKTRQAVKVCATCPVTDACLAYALRERIEVGIYGGKTPGARRGMAGRLGYPRKDAAPCGTVGGYERHLREQTTVCLSCRWAKRVAAAAKAEHTRAYRDRLRREHAAC